MRAFSPYKDGRSSLNYYELPAGVIVDVDALRTWTERSVAVAQTAAAKKRRKK